MIPYERHRMCTGFPTNSHLTLNLSCIEQQLSKEKVFKIFTEMAPKKGTADILLSTENQKF